MSVFTAMKDSTIKKNIRYRTFFSCKIFYLPSKRHELDPAQSGTAQAPSLASSHLHTGRRLLPEASAASLKALLYVIFHVLFFWELSAAFLFFFF